MQKIKDTIQYETEKNGYISNIRHLETVAYDAPNSYVPEFRGLLTEYRNMYSRWQECVLKHDRAEEKRRRVAYEPLAPFSFKGVSEGERNHTYWKGRREMWNARKIEAEKGLKDLWERFLRERYRKFAQPSADGINTFYTPNFESPNKPEEYQVVLRGQISGGYALRETAMQRAESIAKTTGEKVGVVKVVGTVQVNQPIPVWKMNIW